MGKISFPDLTLTEIGPTQSGIGSAELTGRVTIPIRNCRLWSPEDPFLYMLEVRSPGDSLTTRFG